MILLVMIALTSCAGGTDTLNSTSSLVDAMPPYQPTISVPAEFDLPGTLILSDYHRGIFRLDLSTQTLTHIFNLPPDSFLSSAILSPDGQTFAMVYSPPRDIADPLYGVPSLYTLPADGSGKPNPLLGDPQSGHIYFSPWWSPDGQTLYYGRAVYPPSADTPATEPTGYFLTRYQFPSGSAQDLIRNVLAVRISADNRKMFYLSVDLSTALSNIYVADLDGSNSQSLLPGGESWIIDSIAVAPDGESVVFNNGNNAVSQSNTSWLDQLMGVRVVQAHAVPSDLWIVKPGESPRQLTNLASTGFIEDFSPDGQSIVFSCDSGIYVIHTDGTGLTPIVSEPIFASLQWLP
jgi:Tol biopolymer transport system component